MKGKLTFAWELLILKTGRYEDAVDSLRKALIQPDPGVFSYIGRSLYWLNNFSSALRYLKKAVELRGSGTDYFWKGCTLSKMKKYEDAKACFEKSADMRGNASDYHWLGTTLSAMGRTTEAVTPLEKAVELRGDAIDYRKLRNYIRKVRGLSESTIKPLEGSHRYEWPSCR